MRILFVCNYKPGVGGISGQVELLQQKLRIEGHVADIFSTKASVWKRMWMLTKFHSKVKTYDVLHIHCCSGWGFLPAVMGVTIGKRLGKRVVLTYHGGGGEAFFAKHTVLVKRFLSRTDANIVLSGFLAKVFELHQLPYIIIPNIIELEKSAFRLREVINPNYICVRSHEPLYDIPCILRAFQKIQWVVPEASLTLVGSGSQHEQLKRQVQEMGLTSVTFMGRVENKDIYRYLDGADVFVSAPKVDNMPVSVIEAMNAGLLVISSRVGGVPYMVEHGRTGLLFESENDEELTEKMLWAVQHQDEAKNMIAMAHQSVKQYQWDNVKNQLYSVYGLSA